MRLMGEGQNTEEIYQYIEDTYSHFGPSTEDDYNPEGHITNCGGGADGLGSCGNSEETNSTFSLDSLPEASVPEKQSIK